MLTIQQECEINNKNLITLTLFLIKNKYSKKKRRLEQTFLYKINKKI